MRHPARSMPTDRGVARYQLGVALLLHGEADAAPAETQEDLGRDSWGEIGLPRVDHALGQGAESDAALANPRWLPFLRRLGKAPEQLGENELHLTLPE